MSYAYLSNVIVNPKDEQPLYVQLREGIRQLIVNGMLTADTQLPSSRYLSKYFSMHRQTVIAAMDDLVAEGWVVSKERKGLYVNKNLPEIQPRKYGTILKAYPDKSSFSFEKFHNPYTTNSTCRFGFDDGSPDIRIAPYQALGKAYTQTLSERAHRNIISNTGGGLGSKLLRTELAKVMHTYRGINISANNILLTHGSQMSIFLVASKILSKGDNVIVTKPSYQTANSCFASLKAKLLYVPVDENGMDVDAVEDICNKQKVKCIYVTSHHHHPTTVSMSVERRLRLLQLAEQHGFAIIEDDYDYDYHYENKPIFPIAANDKNGNVIYIGSFSKILSHSFRIGYIIAPADFVEELSIYRRIVDRCGDDVLEEAFGKLLKNNVIKNHIRKALVLYRDRRDYAHNLLSEELGNYFDVNLPEGGLAFWVNLDKRISLVDLSKHCAMNGVLFPNGSSYNYDKRKTNACRMGFASMNEKELHKAVDVLKSKLKKI